MEQKLIRVLTETGNTTKREIEAAYREHGQAVRLVQLFYAPQTQPVRTPRPRKVSQVW